MVAPWLALVTMGLVLAMVPLVEPQQPHLAAAPLCGRAFLRAVIFHCGGSRWRRDGKGMLHYVHALCTSYYLQMQKSNGPPWKTTQNMFFIIMIVKKYLPNMAMASLLTQNSRIRNKWRAVRNDSEIKREWHISAGYYGEAGDHAVSTASLCEQTG
uniref:Uncharacterized protein n=1 Tax=Eptatretus burgeri TaxID=7764 RepID=A0A8C4WZB8_EPTBU